MKTMKKIVLAVVLVLALALPVLANPFVDVPLNHWAYDAVQSLAAKGIIIGYPDGTFGGNRAMTRYEFAMAAARGLAYMEQRIDEAGFATQEDVAMLEKLVQEFADELRLLGVTVDDLKRALGEQSEAIRALEARVDVLEKYHEPVLVTGEFNVSYEAFSPTAADKTDVSFEDETTLHIAADINENTIAGVDLIIKNTLAGSDPEVTADNFYIEYVDEEWFVRAGDINLYKKDIGGNVGLVLGDYQPDDPDDDDDYDLDFEGVYVTYAEEDSDTIFRLLAAPNDFYSVRAEWEEVSVAATWFPGVGSTFYNVGGDLVISAGAQTDFDESDVLLTVEGGYGVLQGGYGVAGELALEASDDVTVSLEGHYITDNFTPAVLETSSFDADRMGGAVSATFDLSDEDDDDKWTLEIGYEYDQTISTNTTGVATIVTNEVTGTIVYVPADAVADEQALIDLAYYLGDADHVAGGFAVFAGYDNYPLNDEDDEDESYVSANVQYVSDTARITGVGILSYKWVEDDIAATLKGRYDSKGAEVWSVLAEVEWAMAENTALTLGYELNTWDGDETGGIDDGRGIIDTAGTITAELNVTF